MRLRVPFALVCVTLSALSVFARGPIITSVTINREGISPNGDGVADSVIMSYTLADTATVHVLAFEDDSVTVVDSVLAAGAQLPGAHQASWRGTYSNGSPVPDDNYVLYLRASNAQTSDSSYHAVVVDRVRPQVVVTEFPDPFAPGAPDAPSKLTVEFDVFDPYPSTEVDVRVEIYRPTAGPPIAILADTSVAPGGSHTEIWNGGNLSAEGAYSVRVLATDRGSNDHDVRSSFDVDLFPPDLEITSPVPGLSFRVIPDSLFGWAFDRMSSVDSLFVRYSGGAASFKPIQSTVVRMDTAFFAVQLTDSIVETREYSLGFRAVDPWGRETITLFTIAWDTLRPPAPELNQPPSPTRNPAFVLDGSVSNDIEVMRIFRNGALLDTIFPNLLVSPEFPYPMTLLSGENRIYAVGVDGAGNASVPSNELAIVLDSSPGLVITQPFGPGDSFVLNVAQAVSSATLRIYDLGGKLVRTLDATSPGTSLLIRWNGKNGDNEPVKKGPFVAVAQIQYQSGGSEVFREAFLFER